MSPRPLVFDGHNDTLTHLLRPDRGRGRLMLTESAVGHIDLPRATRGGLGGGIFAIFAHDPSGAEPPITFTPEGYAVGLPEPLPHEVAAAWTDAVIDSLDAIVVASKGAIERVTDAASLRRCLADGTFAVVLHLEGAEAIDPDLERLHHYHARGLRSLGLVWSRPNAFGHGVPFRFPHSPDTGPGLTEAGARLVRACNALGVVVDLSHLNAAGFQDVARLSEAPLVATHSNAHALCASTRNLTDAQLDAVGASGGVIGVNFCPAFLRDDGADDLTTSLDTVVAHVRYIVDRIGVAHVALGSDFDGATVPDALADVTRLPDLLDALGRAGFDADELRQLAHGNWLRLLDATWR